jgi:predicted glycosyl hydrolase (DUF1957 family)
MALTTITAEVLEELARHQLWADSEHWKAFRQNSSLMEDAEIRRRLNHMLMAVRMLTALARGETSSSSAAATSTSALRLG